MKAFKDYKTTESYKGSSKLPVGGYVLDIKKAEEKEFSWGSQLHLMIDISEGDQKDFYSNQYKNNTSEDKKWKGVVRINLPSDDGTDQDNNKKRSFKTIIEHIEDSNEGYAWDWNEEGLKGKKIGGVASEVKTVINGKRITYIEFSPYNLCTVEDIKKGNFTIPDARMTDDYKKDIEAEHKAASGDGFINVDVAIEEELPF